MSPFANQLELPKLVTRLGQSSTNRTFDISTELEKTYSHARKTSPQFNILSIFCLVSKMFCIIYLDSEKA